MHWQVEAMVRAVLPDDAGRCWYRRRPCADIVYRQLKSTTDRCHRTVAMRAAIVTRANSICSTIASDRFLSTTTIDMDGRIDFIRCALVPAGMVVFLWRSRCTT